MLDPNLMQISKNLIIQQGQPIADADRAPRQGQMPPAKIHRELGLAWFLALKQSAHGFDGGVLVVEVGFKMKFHSKQISYYFKILCLTLS